MTDQLTRFDGWLGDEGPAALVIREHLIPVEGPDGVLFPPTFAAGDDFPGGYNIDAFNDGTNVCLIDSVGSQANRIEPLFAKEPYAALVPQVVIVAGTKRVNLLEAGHRAGDAIVRCSELQTQLDEAFRAVLKGDTIPLAKIAPTSLVFGAWDSRNTEAKVPRLLASTIRAYNVRKLTRSAQYVPAVEYVEQGLLEEPQGLQDESGRVKAKHPYAQRGFVHVPASNSPGGVIADGGIRRDGTLHLAALRLLKAGGSEEMTLVLRRYILGLALTAFTYPPGGYLRQGCNLVLDPNSQRSFCAVRNDGRREDLCITHVEALQFASAAAEAFGVGQGREVPFEPKRAAEDLVKSKEARKAKRGKKASSGADESPTSEND